MGPASTKLNLHNPRRPGGFLLKGGLFYYDPNKLKKKGLEVKSVFNIGMLMEQIQAEISALQKRLESMTFEGEAYEGKVKAWANGLQMLVALDLSPELISSLPPAMLSEAVVAACNSALKQARLELNKEIARLTGGSFHLDLRSDLG